MNIQPTIEDLKKRINDLQSFSDTYVYLINNDVILPDRMYTLLLIKSIDIENYKVLNYILNQMKENSIKLKYDIVEDYLKKKVLNTKQSKVLDIVVDNLDFCCLFE